MKSNCKVSKLPIKTLHTFQSAIVGFEIEWARSFSGAQI